MPGRYTPQRPKRVEAGDIYFLPEKSKLDLTTQLAATLEAAYCKHPLVVLSVEDDKLNAEILILSSLKCKDLEEKTQNLRGPARLQIRRQHLPIHDAPAHPDNGILLHLDGNLKLPKKTYVKAETCHRLPCRLMDANFCDSETGRKYCLRADSLKSLVQYVKSEYPRSPSFDLKIPTGDQRLPSRPALATVDANIVRHYGATQSSTPYHTPNLPALLSTEPARSDPATAKPQSSEREAVLGDLSLNPSPSNWRPRLAENRPLLPPYMPSRYNAASHARSDSRPLLRRLYIAFILIAVIFLAVAYWQCQLSNC